MQVPCSKQNNLAWYGRYCANAASADYGSRGIPPAWTIPVMRRFRNQRLGVVEPRREMKSKAFESLVASLSASVCGQGRVGKSRNGFGATRSSLCRRYVCRARPGQFHGTENQRWSVVSFSFRCGRHAAGSHCFGGGSEQNRRPSLHLEKVSQPQDRFTGWQLGTWGDPPASFEFRTLPHPPRKRRDLSYLRLVCGLGFANPTYRAAAVPIFRGGVGEAGPISLELNSPTCTRSSKPMQIRFVRDPFSGYFRVTFLLRGCRRGKPRQGFAVVPGHPLRRVLPQLLRVPLQLGQIVERIDTIEFARVNQAHEQVSQRSACSRARAKSSSGIRASIA